MTVLKLVPRDSGSGLSGSARLVKTRPEPPATGPDKLLQEGWLSSRKPTSLDIAYLAGVSQATVSRALRDSKLVSEATRERVKQVARQLNYQIDRNAASLRSQRTQTLALLIFEDPTSDSSHINPFFLRMLGTITRAASRQGYDLLVSFQQLSQDWYTEYELSNRADGIILLGYGDYTRFGPKIKGLIDADAHFVIWGPPIEERPTSCLGSDNLNGARTAVEHLIGLGRRNIAFVGDTHAGYPEFLARYQGYQQALEAADLPVDPELQVDGDNQESCGQNAVNQLLDNGKKFDAVFAASDLIAIGALQALQERGLAVPDEVSVVGFDDIPAASYVSPPLTTVHQDTAQAGRMLVNNLIAMINGEEVKSSQIPLELVIRKSCGAG
ncbi:MAG: LacI family DNA-binding transcriptional regulator [Xanthomonadales bacterium]|nr:LacI family DNA-binding transcriptional regulator [Xanthomonadales bacterium]